MNVLFVFNEMTAVGNRNNCCRLIRGTGEIVEEMVSKYRHQTINKEATKADGDSFQQQSLALAKSSLNK